ncbi:MAG TPA: hypothetical protein VHR84_06315 [Terriglobales bacterium]|jgi:hypothetical protein|nr:hypothetical protein [Terriglobales bacterium]
MSGQAQSRRFESQTDALAFEKIATFSRMRVLAWAREDLYASRGYEIFSVTPGKSLVWRSIAEFHAPAWRRLTSGVPLASRLFRDGFHALCVLPSGSLIGAVPGAIVTCPSGENTFHVTHVIQRGTRPLHVTASPNGCVYWGEYFDNPDRREVHIYCSSDSGLSWNVAYTFPAKAIRHVHNIVFDRWQNCLWILTGDYGHECRVLRASIDFKNVEPVLEGNQQARAVAFLPTPAGMYFASDTPLEKNSIYRMRADALPEPVVSLNHSSIHGCAVQNALFFTTMVEPSTVNTSREAHLYGSLDGEQWKKCFSWKKDPLPMRLFQYGNCFLPDGQNETHFLAASTLAVEGASELILWRVLDIH